MKKNKVVYTIAVLFFLNHAFGQVSGSGKSFVIKGTLNGVHVDSVLLDYQNAAGRYTRISQPVYGNLFSLNGEIAIPRSARIMFKNTGEVIPHSKEDFRRMELYIEPGIMTLSGDPSDLNSLKLSGSKTETEFEELEASTLTVREQLKPLQVAFMEETDHEKAAAIHAQFDPYNNRIKKITYRFALDHPNSYVTLEWMRVAIADMGLDSSIRIYNNFNDELKSTPAAKELNAKIKIIEAGMPGSIAAGFSKMDINGKRISLADFRGRYIILDFWASWCVPCRQSNPHMIELFNKYKNMGFDIIGVASDDRAPNLWKAAVAHDNTGVWHQVLSDLNMDLAIKHINNPDYINDKYGIMSLPTKILIDPNGKIIGRYGDSFGGTDEDMDKMLLSIFDK